SQAIVLAAGGTGIGDKADSFHFMSVADKGTTQVIANVRDFTRINDGSMAGVMFRESLDPDAALVFIGPVSDGKSGRAIIRNTKRLAAQVVPQGSTTSPAALLATGQWLRPQRNGATISAYAGTRAGVSTAQTKIAEVTLKLANPMANGYFGLAATSGQPATTT